MRVPVVLMDRGVPLEIDTAAIDHWSGARTATWHLLALGRRRVALLTGLAAMRPALVRTGGLAADVGFEQLSRLPASRRPQNHCCHDMLAVS